MYVHFAYSLDKRTSFYHWFKSGVLVVAGYVIIAIVIWLILYDQPDRTPIDSSPIAAPIVLDIAPMPVSTQIVNNLSDEQNQPVIAASAQKVSLANPVNEKTAVVSVEDKRSGEVGRVQPKKTLNTMSIEKTKQEDIKDLEKKNSNETLSDAAIEQQAQQSSNNSVPTEIKQDKSKAPEVGSFNTETTKESEQNWENQVLAKLQKMKRYPAYAQHMKQQDVVMIRIVINEKGMLLDNVITQSQKMTVLDNEVRALVKRAQPYPVPPMTAMLKNRITLEVPIEFFLK